MIDLIDRQAAIDALGDEGLITAMCVIARVTSVQTDIIRCGECKYMMPDGRCVKFAADTIRPSASDYCSYAERKNNMEVKA